MSVINYLNLSMLIMGRLNFSVPSFVKPNNVGNLRKRRGRLHAEQSKFLYGVITVFKSQFFPKKTSAF